MEHHHPHEGSPRENTIGGLMAFGVGLVFLIIIASAAYFLARFTVVPH